MSGEFVLAIAGALALLALTVFAFRKAKAKRAIPPSAANNWRRAELTAEIGELRSDTLPTRHVGLGSGGTD